MNPRFQSHSNRFKMYKKKGFLQIDFAFVALIFFLVFYFIYTFYGSYQENLNQDKSNTLFIADSKDICNMLILTPGYPSNWQANISSLVFIGMKNISGNYSLDSSKINAFNSVNYLNITDKLYLENEFITIKIIGLKTNTSYLDFGEESNVYQFSIYSCYSNFNNEPVKVTVEIWK